MPRAPQNLAIGRVQGPGAPRKGLKSLPKLGTGQGEAKAEPGGKSRLQGAGQGGRAARGEP